MKNKELIELLSIFNEDDEIFIVGYEGGLEKVIDATKKTVVLNTNPEEWMGPHDEFNKTRIIDDSRIVSGIFLKGEKNRKP